MPINCLISYCLKLINILCIKFFILISKTTYNFSQCLWALCFLLASVCMCLCVVACLCDANFSCACCQVCCWRYRFVVLSLAGRFIEFCTSRKIVKKQARITIKKTASMVTATKRVVAHFYHLLIYSFS